MNFLKPRKRKANPSALELLREHVRMLDSECMSHLQNMGTAFQALDEDWEKKISEEASFIIDLCKGKEALEGAISTLKKPESSRGAKGEGPRYQISSMFLRECWEYLTSDPSRNERLHLVTGTITEEGTRVLSRMEKVKLGKQNPGYVSADDIDSHTRIISLAEEHGHLLLAMFHSHPSRGAKSTYPSSIDTAFMGRMAKMGCECIGGIFSPDGFVRFFSMNREFDIGVYGRGVRKIHDKRCSKIFQIINTGTVA